MDIEIKYKTRKSKILTTGGGTCCLRRSGVITINMTSGCQHGCIYCYANVYRQNKKKTVFIYEDIHEQIRNEILTKRKPVYKCFFSSSSDCFQPIIQPYTYWAMKYILDSNIEVGFLTKGSPNEENMYGFTQLFTEYKDKISAQIGICSTNEHWNSVLEPGSSKASDRLNFIKILKDIGVRKVTARLDPLFPGITDTDDFLIDLLDKLRDLGITEIASGYLFLRPKILDVILSLHNPNLIQMLDTFYSNNTNIGGCVGENSMHMDTELRQARFDNLKKLAEERGIKATICICKNPDLIGSGLCKIAGDLPDIEDLV